MAGRAKGTLKYMGNKMKPMGLQKLRWYCQLCRKQCRDGNGFKCHTMSESHQRQLLLFSDNSLKYIDDTSKQFADGYLEFLQREYGTKRVHANKVYQEYIFNKHHLPINTTQWATLTEFVKWLGREGKCVLDETDMGWYVAYIDNDAAAIAAHEAKIRREKMDKEDQERMLEFINSQVEKGMRALRAWEETQDYTEYRRDNNLEKASSSFNMKRKADSKREPPSRYALSRPRENPKRSGAEAMQIYEVASLEIMRKMWEAARRKELRREQWICVGIVVKIITSKLGEEFNKKKGAIVRVEEGLTAVVRLAESIEQEVPQKYLETVIPTPGERVRFVNGPHIGKVGVLKRIDLEDFCCEVEIMEGSRGGRLIREVQYEDVSKVATY